MYPFYLGIDLHLKRTYLVLMNGEGDTAIFLEIELPNQLIDW
jgi:hypothetical protein